MQSLASTPLQIQVQGTMSSSLAHMTRLHTLSTRSPFLLAYCNPDNVGRTVTDDVKDVWRRLTGNELVLKQREQPEVEGSGVSA